MRFSSFLPLALVAAASVAVARPVDDYMFFDADLYLEAREDFDPVDLLEREYVESELVARASPLYQPQRGHYKTVGGHDKTSPWREWNRRMGHARMKIKAAVDSELEQQGGSQGVLSKLFSKKKQ
ncbi:hypothetical protein EVJ58_g7163 [Rhodofomes roseus]|uniref:Uncharacterized protein n=1 Tax=Rhodofomes roseus TaxID=34475 RepID=A0A4Y9Y701_9APHY|nr:hypothetical protein EVJ58_g7163 [Rhodofomes roseus]